MPLLNPHALVKCSQPMHVDGTFGAAMAGTMKSFLDRAFFVSTANGGLFHRKIGAAAAAVRRSGGISTVETLNHGSIDKKV